MGIFRQFPYSNFHDMNMDQIIKIMRQMQDEWAETKSEWASYKEFIDNYFDNLNVEDEVLRALRIMAGDGTLNTIMDPVIVAETADWLAEHITVTQGETVIDTSLSIAGAAADAKETGERIYNVRSDLLGVAERNYNNVNNKINNLVQFWGLNRHGFINGNTGAFNPGASGTGLNASTDYIMINKNYPVIIRNIAGNAIKCNIVQYDGGMNFITANYFENVVYSITPNQSAKWIRLSFCTNDAAYDNTAVFQPCNYRSDIIARTFWRNGSLGNIQNQEGISTEYILPRNDAESVTITLPEAAPAGYNYRFQISTYSADSGTTWENVGNRITRDFTAVPGKMNYTYKFTDNSIGFGVTLYLLGDGGDYLPLRIATFNAPDKVVFIKNFKNDTALTDYAVGSSLIRQPVSLTNVGVLSGVQAFCKYGSHWYSTDGTNLYEQDESFALTDTIQINAGHGNSLQLGHNGNAFISGWNDQKIYIVNLDSKRVIRTITLPITGYFTAGVDDVNSIAYIFQRDTNPEYVDWYKLIKYNYDTNQILGERWLAPMFAAIQSVDYLDGKMFVVNGLGTNSSPNGYRIFNSAGDVIGEYKLNSIQTEPEGVYIDRDNYDVYISNVNGTLYRIN